MLNLNFSINCNLKEGESTYTWTQCQKKWQNIQASAKAKFLALKKYTQGTGKHLTTSSKLINSHLKNMLLLGGGPNKENCLSDVDRTVIYDILGADNPILVGVAQGIDT